MNTELTCFFVSIGPVSMLGSPTDYGTRKRFVATFKCYPLLWMLHSVGKPRLSVCCRWLIRSWKVRGQLFCHKHQTNKLGPLWVTHNLWGTWQGWEGGGVCVMFLVIVSLSPSTFTRQQQTDMKMEQLLDAAALFLCDTPQPFLLHSLRGNMTRRDACTDWESEQIVFQTSLGPKALVGQLP